jgi:demethylmenaquinone methyltransferase/2-methoxy-6-polyprenyl-1,4-benzoquinol methylase
VSAADNKSGKSAIGAMPAGAVDEQAAATAVREMFNGIAGRYDLLNHVLSANVDRIWWWRTARSFRHILLRNDAQVLDLCSGTGDMALSLRKQAPPQAADYFAADFSHEMLRRGAQKFTGKRIIAIEADALSLPFRDSSFDLVLSAFGFRNLANYENGLREIYRILKPGGEFGILDFSEPGGVFGKLYSFYFKRILPRIGAALSGSRVSYEYLPASVQRFPSPQELLSTIHHVGLKEGTWTPYTFGIAGLYRGIKKSKLADATAVSETAGAVGCNTKISLRASSTVYCTT